MSQKCDCAPAPHEGIYTFMDCPDFKVATVCYQDACNQMIGADAHHDPCLFRRMDGKCPRGYPA